MEREGEREDLNLYSCSLIAYHKQKVLSILTSIKYDPSVIEFFSKLYFGSLCSCRLRFHKACG